MSSYTSFREYDIDGNIKAGSYIVEQVLKIEKGIIITKKVVLKLPKIKRKRKDS